jgi:hypothetical protein
VVNCGCLAGNRAVWLAIMAMTAGLGGCAQQVPTAAPSARVFAVDQAGGARNCTVPGVVPVAGKETTVAMKFGNDGGWCAITVANAGKPFDAGLLATAPAHGKVLIHTVGSETRIDYTPAPRFTGTDAFAVRLIPGDAVLQARVTVGPP